MQTLILAFYLGRKSENKNTEFFDRLICWVTRSRYSHVEIVTHYNPKTGVGTCWSSSPRDGGVRFALIDLHDGHWELFEVPASVDNQYTKDWFEDRKGAKYDWLGAFGSVLFVIPQMASRWFCSEAVASAMALKNTSRTTPERLYRYFKNVSYRIPL